MNRYCIKQQRGISAIEFAIALPLLLGIFMMTFEVARVTLTQSLLDMAIENSSRNYRLSEKNQSLTATDRLQTQLRQQINQSSVLGSLQLDISSKRYVTLEDLVNDKPENSNPDARLVKLTVTTEIPFLLGLIAQARSVNYHNTLVFHHEG